MGEVVKEFTDMQISQDHQSASNIEWFISEGCPFNAPHTNVLGELLGEVVGFVASDDCIKE